MIFRCIYKTKTGVKNNLPYGGASGTAPYAGVPKFP